MSPRGVSKEVLPEKVPAGKPDGVAVMACLLKHLISESTSDKIALSVYATASELGIPKSQCADLIRTAVRARNRVNIFAREGFLP